MMYGSKVVSLIYSMVYKPLGKCDSSMFWSQGFRSLECKPLNELQMSQRRVNMGFGEGYSTQVGLIMNMMNGSISLQFHIIVMILYSVKIQKSV